MNHPQIIKPDSIETYRYRVKFLGQELAKETNQLRRSNMALQLADAATTLARLEAEELQNQHSTLFRKLWETETSSIS